jgi:hypothetical protein
MRDRNRLSLGQGIPVEIENRKAGGAMAPALAFPRRTQFRRRIATIRR